MVYVEYKKFVLVCPFIVAAGFLFFGDGRVPLTLFMVAWMVSVDFEVVPLGVTSLLPMVFLPFSGLMGIKSVVPYYSNHLIYLFLGGLLLPVAWKTRLNERIALVCYELRGVRIGGFAWFSMATAFLSMWISNTATTVMMVPIGLSVLTFLRDNIDEEHRASIGPMATVLFLAIAYSANIGGIGRLERPRMWFFLAFLMKATVMK